MASFYVKDNNGNLIAAQFLSYGGNYVADPNTSFAQNTKIFDANGNQISNANPYAYLIIPADYSVSNAISNAQSIQNSMTVQTSESGEIISTFPAALNQMITDFKQNGIGDSQRSYNGNNGNGVFVSAFTDATSFNLGLYAAYAGIPLTLTEAAGGAYNIYNSIENLLAVGQPLNTDGAFFNNPANVNSMTSGYSFGQTLPGASGTQADPTTLTAAGNSGSDYISANIILQNNGNLQINENLNNGTSQSVTFVYNSDGSISQTTIGYSGTQLSGTAQFTQTTSLAANNAISANVTGMGDNVVLNNASIAFAAGTQAAIDGANNAASLAGNVALTLAGSGNLVTDTTTGDDTVNSSGSNSFNINNSIINANGTAPCTDGINCQGDTINASNGDTITIAGDGQGSGVAADTVNMSSGTVELSSGATANVDGNGDSISVAGSDTIGVSGASDNVNMSASSTDVASDVVTISGQTQEIAFGNGIDVNVANGTQASVTGADGTLTANDNSANNGIQATLDFNAGGSQQQLYSGLPNNETSAFDNYSGANATGTDTSNVLDFSGGYSQQQLFTGLPSGDSEQINSYSGLNDTGTLGSTVWNESSGGSQVDSYSGLSGGATSDLQNFTGLNGGGSDTYNIVDFSNGTSQYQQLSSLPSGDSEVIQSYSGLNDSGTLDSTMSNETSGASQYEQYSDLPSGETSDLQSFTGLNGSGTDTSNVIDYNGGYSQQQLFTDLPNGDTEEINSYGGLNATGTLGSTIWDESSGASNVENYNPASGESSNLQSFTGLNGSGTDTSNTIDYTNGTSEQQLFTGIPSGDTEQVNFYSGTNLGGKLDSTTWNESSGGSQIEEYTPQSNVSDLVEDFNGLNGAGTNDYNILNYTNDTSQYQQLSNLASGTIENIAGYSGASLTGNEKYTVANFSNDQSTIEILNPASGVNNTYQGFQDLNGSGNLNWQTLYNTNNTSAVIAYDYDGNSDLTHGTFYQGSTELGYGTYTNTGAYVGTYNGLSVFSEDDSVVDNTDDFDEFDGEDDEDDGGDDDAVGGGGGGRFSSPTVISSNNTSVTLSDNTSYSITGSGNIITTGNSDTVAMNDSAPNTVLLAGDNSSLTDSGTGDSYNVTGQNNYLNVSNASIQLGDNVTVEISSNTSSLGIGNIDNVTLDSDSYFTTVTLSGINSTLADNGASNTIAVDGQGNSIDFSGNTTNGTLVGSLATFNGTTEQIVLSNMETIAVESGIQASIIGTDGTMTVSNNSTSGTIKNTIDWNAGGAETQTFTTSAGSITEVDQGFDGSNGSGNQLYEQQTITDSSGNVTSTISGQGAVTDLSNATITLSDNATATLDGNANMVTAGNDSTLNTGANSVLNTITLSGDNAVLNDAGNGDAVTLSGSSDSVVMSGDLMNTATLTIGGANSSLDLTGASSDNIVFNDNGTGTLKLDFPQGFSGTVAGLADNDNIDLTGLLFSGAPTITSVTGTGAAGTATDITLSDGHQTAMLALLNQYASQYTANSSAYSLTADNTSATAGTLFHLAAAH